MEVEVEDTSENGDEKFNIQDLPDEILKKIFHQLCQYKDFDNLSMVCNEWRRLIKDVQHEQKRNFEKCFLNKRIVWTEMLKNDHEPVHLSVRVLHSMCYNEMSRCVYIFGGKNNSGNSSAGFNDIWKLSLVNKIWTRPLISGQFPPPKYATTMESYRDKLYLFGGSLLSAATPFSMNRTESSSNDLHIFDVINNTWESHPMLQAESPRPLHRHQATIISNREGDDTFMFVFGGIVNNGQCSQRIWCLDIKYLQWSSPVVIGNPPPARHSHSQSVCTCDFMYNSAVLIVGGVNGSQTHHDAWLLTQSGFNEWTSVKLTMEPGPDNFVPPVHVFKAPSVKVGSCLVFVTPCPKDKLPEDYGTNIRYTHYNSTTQQGVNGTASRSRIATQPQQQLTPTVNQRPNNPLCLYILDISAVVTHQKITWRNTYNEDNKISKTLLGPNRTNFYRIVVAKNEIVIHGDAVLTFLQRELMRRTRNNQQHISSLAQMNLYFLSYNVFDH